MLVTANVNLAGKMINARVAIHIQTAGQPIRPDDAGVDAGRIGAQPVIAGVRINKTGISGFQSVMPSAAGGDARQAVVV